MKKVFAILLALTMLLAMAVPAMAQDKAVGTTGGGTITISNAAKDETYTIYKLFDASVTGTTDGSIAYTGTIPDTLTTYFQKDSAGNILATDAAWKNPATKTEMSDGLKSALKTWAATATATASEKSDGSTLHFTHVPYGYYVVTTTQGKQAITVDSTNPTVTIIDKNTTLASPVSGTDVKSVDDADVNIGQTVTYTVTFATANYTRDNKKIVSYTIEDTLPDFLTNVNVTSIIVDDDGDFENTTGDQYNVTAQFADKKITIDWYDEDSAKFRYANGAVLKLTYTAVVTDKAAIDGDGNTNTVTISWTNENGEVEDDTITYSETIYTYAIALKKVNDKGVALSGAVFELPFYVKSTADTTDGAYIYAGTIAGEGLTNELTTPDDGMIVIKGVEPGIYSITEVTAPNGYNKLTAPIPVTATKTGITTTNTKIYLDANGDVTETATETVVEITNDNIAATAVAVVNKTGSELPATGGIGTTIFYVVGGLLMAAAVVLLVTKKKVASGK